jgi:SOS-response transcriptional repressor LexA
MKVSEDCDTQIALARKARVSQSTVQRLLKGLVNSQRDTLERICDAVGMSVGELLGEVQEGAPGTYLEGDSADAAAKAQRVPLISWVQAGSFTESIDIYEPGYAEHWIPKPPKPCGPRTVALRIEGISMEPDYRAGDIIYVDPGVQPTNGKDVVIRLDDRNEATFKRLVTEARRSYLKPINPAWPEQIIEFPEDARIVGVVIGTWTDR